jgi:hypothetical protein
MPDDDYVPQFPAQAGEANERGLRAAEAGQVEEAERCYREAIRVAPKFALPWFNLGLLYKHQRRWLESLECNLEASRLAEPGAQNPSFWNLAIAATALGEWRTAREAWRGYGSIIPEGDGPLVMDLGPVPIRVDVDRNSEVVWCHRIDPARAIILSVPLPQSGRRRGDVVLMDGEPRGYRELDGVQVPVFNELQLLAASGNGTFSARVTAPGLKDLEDLHAEYGPDGPAAEDWERVEMRCRACSEGPPQGHDHPPEVQGPGPYTRTFGLAARDENEARRYLDVWTKRGSGRRWSGLKRVL